MPDPLQRLTPTQWREFLTDQPQAHLLQTAAWGELKSHFGWDVVRIEREHREKQVGVQILFRRLPLGFSFAYIPKGPVGDADLQQDPGFWEQIDFLCRERRAVFLKFEPDSSFDDQRGEHQSPPEGFQTSPQSIQPARTIVVDLRGDEETILARMKQKTRYNIRLAGKKGVVVRPTENVELFYQLMETTGERDEFGIHTIGYYRRAYELFHPNGSCELFLAEFDGTPLAGLMVFWHGSRAWYLYGASTSHHREKMPSYLLQWEAMKWAREKGCTHYDLWGIPDYDQEQLEAEFMDRSEGLWGVYRFKRGFGGQVVRSAGPWDRVYQLMLYQVYLKWVAKKGIEP